MQIITMKVKCPICGNVFPAKVLKSYSVETYDYDFMPVFTEGPETLRYYIWFCESCHFSGYDNRFYYESYIPSISEEKKKKVLLLDKSQTVTTAYIFYRAGLIAEAFQETALVTMDFYLKSFWAARMANSVTERHSARIKVMVTADAAAGEIDEDDSENHFVILYLMGFMCADEGNSEEAVYYFSKLLSRKLLPVKYEKYLQFAIDYIKEYHRES